MPVTQLSGKQVLDASIAIIDIDAEGVPSSTTFLRGDGIWANPLSAIVTTLMTYNSTTDLQPIDDYYGQTGLFELNTNGDLQPTLGETLDYTLDLDLFDNIRPNI